MLDINKDIKKIRNKVIVLMTSTFILFGSVIFIIYHFE